MFRFFFKHLLLQVEENAGVFNGMANIVMQTLLDYSPHVEPGHEEYDTRRSLLVSLSIIIF